jgi:hypothetical protein
MVYINETNYTTWLSLNHVSPNHHVVKTRPRVNMK